VVQTEGYFVARTMRAVELLAFGPVSAPELAAVLQVHPRTARRLLGRLLDEGYVTRRAGARRYHLSLRLAAVAAQAITHGYLPGCAMPLLDRLHARTGLTAQLWAPSYTDVVCLAHSPPAGCAALGELVPAPMGAAGKALLAARPCWRASVLDALAATPRVSASALQAETARIAELGFAVAEREPHGGWGLAAVICVDDDPIAAVAATGAGARDTAAVTHEVLQLVHDLQQATDARTR
jgi:DNA-binding IclR family transcriptional regulator